MGQQPLAGLEVLIVEDDYFIASDIEAILNKAGARVLGPFSRAEQARSAVQARSGSPLVAILDINLAGAMVYPLAEDLRRAGVPFVFATGYDDGNVPARFATVPRLLKPVDTRRLLESVSAVANLSPPSAKSS